MVKHDPLRVVAYVLPPKPFPADRKIQGPRYDLREIQKWLSPDKIWIATQQCETDVLALRWEAAEVCELLLSLEEHHYKGSEWCETGAKKVIDCDAYSINFDARTLLPSATGLNLYIKFGLPVLAGALIIVSCHP